MYAGARRNPRREPGAKCRGLLAGGVLRLEFGADATALTDLDAVLARPGPDESGLGVARRAGGAGLADRRGGRDRGLAEDASEDAHVVLPFVWVVVVVALSYYYTACGEVCQIFGESFSGPFPFGGG